ncbi:MAG: ATP-binding protein [Gemmatimonadota bacterium]
MLAPPTLSPPETYYRELFEQIGAVQLLIDPDSATIVDANPAAAAFYGYPREALRGLAVTELDTQSPDDVMQAIQLATTMGGHYRGFPHRLAGGEIRLVELYAGPLHLDGRVLLHAIVHDVTDQIRMERARGETEAAARRLGLVAVGVAHEVRNPLFGISSALDAFQARFGERAEFAPYLKVLGDQVERLSRLMRDLLEYGKPSQVELRLADPTASIAQALLHCQPLAERQGVQLRHIASGPSAEVAVDQARALQLWQNLIENAIQHAPPGSQVEVVSGMVQEEGRQWVEVKIADHGPGFRVEDLPRIFEPFFTRRQGGTGLGLAIVERIVAEHGGVIEAANGAGDGALIRVRFPVPAA